MSAFAAVGCYIVVSRAGFPIKRTAATAAATTAAGATGADVAGCASEAAGTAAAAAGHAIVIALIIYTATAAIATTGTC